MAREKKTRFVLLGLLAYRPMSGYDIKRAIENSLSFFWNESYGQIYPMLNELADEGLVIKKIEESFGKPDRHVYSITEKGFGVFQGWMTQPAEPARHRIEVLLKVFFGGMSSKFVTINHIRKFKEEQCDLLQTLLHIKEAVNSQWAGSTRGTYSIICLQSGIRVTQATVEWCDEAIQMLSELPNDEMISTPYSEQMPPLRIVAS